MLAARIKLGKMLLDPATQPSFNFTHSHGKVKLNLSIDLDPSSFMLADDNDGTTDQAVLRDFRDATIGVDLMSKSNLSNIRLDLVDLADDTSAFVISATVETKLPGTGGTVSTFKVRQDQVNLQKAKVLPTLQ